MSAGRRSGAAVLAIFALLLATVALGVPAASAYPVGTSPTIFLDHSSGPVKDTVVVTGVGFTPGMTATLVFHSAPVSLGSAGISASGTFTMPITVPAVPLGAHSVVATDVASGNTASAAFDVSGTGTGGTGGGIAKTGVAVLGIGALGLVLLIGGGLMLMAGRRRKAVG